MARLPIPGADEDQWGTLLNEFLRVSHHEDGTLRGVCTVINVRDFGASGDGATDDTAALQAAFDSVTAAGAIVCVPPGTYMVSRALALRSKTYLKGAGTGTVFKRVDSGGNVIFFSETVTDVTIEAISIDLNGARPGPDQTRSFATGLAFRTQCSNLRIRDVRIFDSTGTNVCCRHGILVLESDHVWIERNYLTDGLRLKAGGIGDKLIIENNIIEDANDNAITIACASGPVNTVNYMIRGNIVKAARGVSIYIGDDGGEDQRAGLTYQNIVVDGNLLFGPVLQGQSMLLVKLANFTERLHVVNNILVNIGETQQWTAGIVTTIQTTFGQVGTDFLIANNTVDGAFDHGGIWIQSLNRVRIVHNQVSNVLVRGIRVTGVDTAVIQGNLVTNSVIDLLVENSTNMQVMGNSFRGSTSEGIHLYTSDDSKILSAQLIGNKVSDNAGIGVSEVGPGTFDTQYLFNDLRNNAGGAFSGVNAGSTRLGNLGTTEAILRHISIAIENQNPPPVDPGSFRSIPFTINGARVGDTVATGFSQPLPTGALLAGAVTAPDTVTVTLFNMGIAAFDLGPGTVRIDVWQH